VRHILEIARDIIIVVSPELIGYAKDEVTTIYAWSRNIIM